MTLVSIFPNHSFAQEHWIKSKYVFRFFIKHESLLHEKDPGLRLYEVSRANTY